MKNTHLIGVHRLVLLLLSACVTASLAAAPACVTVRWAETHQRITGFGGSGGNDSAGNFQKLTPENQRRLCDLLFDVKKGIGLTMVRNEIYTWKIQPAPDTWDWSKDDDQVWLMRQAKARGVTNFWSAVWSPPIWMKSNGILTNGGSLLPEHSQAYASLLVRYVREYKSRFGLDISGISISNEPEIKQSYQSTVWTGEEMRDFIRDHLGPALRKVGLPTRLIVPENCTWDHLAKWADVILADAGARDFVSIIAAHQYDQSYTGSAPKFPPPTPEPAYPLARTCGKELWQTEVSFIGGKPDPGIEWGLGTALLIHNAMAGGEVNAWCWWALLNSWKDNEGLTDLAGDSFIVNKRLWAFGNFSRFVRPGWVMIGATSNPATNVFVSAFKDPFPGSQFALVAINNTDAAVALQTRFDGFFCAALTPWVTDAASDLSEKPPVKGLSASASLVLDPKSITTFVGAAITAPGENLTKDPPEQGLVRPTDADLNATSPTGGPGPESPATRAHSATVQVNLEKLLNARVIITQRQGQLQLMDHTLDHGYSILITKTAADVSKAGRLNALQDSGLFPANDRHPEVRLNYADGDGGPQVCRMSAQTETIAIPVQQARYHQMQAFFISANGPTPISVTLRYADGSMRKQSTKVPDFYFLPTAADPGWFVLVDDFGKVDKQGKMTETDHHYIHGLDLNPDAGKVLLQVELTKENSGSVLNLFGLTGTTVNPEHP